MKIRVLALTLAALFIATTALTLDSSTIRDIKRAKDLDALAEEAEDITKDMASKTPADMEEAALIAAETQVYLSYIAVRQNQFFAEKLDELTVESE